jgi:hypothetical protein
MYESGHWSCVGSFTFKACLKACLFCQPPRIENKCKEDYEVFFVYTNDGMQANILPNLTKKNHFHKKMELPRQCIGLT